MTLVLVDAEQIQGVAEKAAADAVFQAAPRQHVEGRVLLGQANRIVDGQQRDAGAEADPARAGGGGGRHHGGGTEGVGRIMVLAKPGRVKAQLLGQHDLVEDMAVVFGGRTVDLGVVVRVEEQTEFHERAPEGVGRAAGSAGARPRAASKRGITSRAKSSREWR